MAPQPPLEDWLRRPQRYWYIDGLTEMAVGGVFVLVALTFLVPWLLPSQQGLVMGILQPLVVIVAVLGARPLVRYLKERITYPRTGRVNYRQPTPARRRWLIALTFLIALGLAALVTRIGATFGQRWLPMVSAFSIAFIAALGVRLRLMRFLVLALYILGLGALITWLAPAEPLDALAFFGLTGLGWLASGGWALWHYLCQTHPPSAEEAQ